MESIKNYPKIKYINYHKDLDVFYGVTDVGSPVWGRLDNEGNATEVHPLYVRNKHTNFISATESQMESTLDN